MLRSLLCLCNKVKRVSVSGFRGESEKNGCSLVPRGGELVKPCVEMKKIIVKNSKTSEGGK